jgi:hypothetical protein
LADLKSYTEVLAVKDESHERPIPSAWRPVFREIVRAFVRRDYRLSAGVPGVAPVTNDTAAHIAKYVENYGETLVELPEETWDSSVCIWLGDRWDALVDLWTRAEGRSDLVLSARIFESDMGFQFQIHMVYVP